MFIVVWKQEDKDGKIIILDETFPSKDEAENHIRKLEEDAKTLEKYFKLMSMSKMRGERIKVNNAHKGRNLKGKGYHGRSRQHAMNRKGIRTRRK